MSYSIPLRGKLSGNPEISLAADMQIRVRDRFIEPLTLSRDDILGWSDPNVLDEAEERIWKRIPKLYRIRSSQLSGKLNLAILFREPVLLPPLKASAVKEMGLTHKQNRQGVWADGVVLQAEDPVEAGQLLGAWGVPSFDSGTEAFTALVGVEENPQAAKRLQEERDAERRKAIRRFFFYSRLAALALLGQMAVRAWEAELPWVDVAIAVGTSAISAILLAFIYRRARFGFGAPEGGRPHGRVFAGMVPLVAGGLVGLLALRSSGCYCSFPELFQKAVFYAPMAWGAGAFVATFGMLGIKGPAALMRRSRPASDRPDQPVGVR